jgi:hypothetical protein
MEKLTLNKDEEQTFRLRQIVLDSFSFPDAVRRVMAERKIDEGRARVLVAKAGKKGSELYNEFRRQGN